MMRGYGRERMCACVCALCVWSKRVLYVCVKEPCDAQTRPNTDMHERTSDMHADPAEEYRHQPRPPR